MALRGLGAYANKARYVTRVAMASSDTAAIALRSGRVTLNAGISLNGDKITIGIRRRFHDADVVGGAVVLPIVGYAISGENVGI